MIKSTLAIDKDRKFKISIVSKELMPHGRRRGAEYIANLITLINDNVNDISSTDAIKIEVPIEIKANGLSTRLKKSIPKNIKISSVKDGNLLFICKLEEGE